MAQAGLAEFCQDIESIDVERMACQFASLEEQHAEITLRLQQQAEIYRAALDEQYGRVFHNHAGVDRRVVGRTVVNG
jgi:hypothetical protein